MHLKIQSTCSNTYHVLNRINSPCIFFFEPSDLHEKEKGKKKRRKKEKGKKNRKAHTSKAIMQNPRIANITKLDARSL